MRINYEWFVLVILVFFCMNCTSLLGQSTQDLPKIPMRYLTQSFDVFEDKLGNIPQDSIFNGSYDTNFKSIQRDKFYGGTSNSIFWLKSTLFEIGNTTGILEVDAPYFNSVTLFRISADGSIDSTQNGMITLLDDREIQSGSIGFNINTKDTNQNVYIRLHANIPISTSIRFYSNNEWSAFQNWRKTILTIYVTLFTLLSIGCVIIWLMRKETLFLYYLGTVISFSGVVLYSYGFAYELWEFPFMPSLIPTLVAICTSCLFGVFRALLSLLNAPYPLFRKSAKIGMVLFLVYAIVCLYTNSGWMLLSIFMLFALCNLLLALASAYLKSKGIKGLLLFMIGCFLLFLTILVRAYDLFGSGVLPNTFKIFPVFFVLGQMVLFLLGFVYQSNMHQKARVLAEFKLRESLAKLEEYRERLEHLIPEQNNGNIHDAYRETTSAVSIPNKLEDSELNSLLITPLSARELEVLRQVSKGLSNRETAEALFISINTVKTHLLRIYEKLDVKNRTEAAIRAGEMKLLD